MMRKSRRFLRLALLGGAFVLCLASAVTGVGAWLVAGELLAPAPSVVGAAPSDLPIEVVTVPSASGADLAGWFAPADDGSPQRGKGVVVLLHPIRGSRHSMLNRARLFHAAGYAVLLIDLQAHGESAGAHITAGYLERLDAAAAVAFARSRCADMPIIVDGASLGGAAALLASPLHIDALIIESVYPTIDEAVRNRVSKRLPWIDGLLTELLLVQLKPRLGVDRTQLRPIDHMANIECPVLLIVGERDPLTTLAESQRMFDAAREPKEMCIIEDAGHVDLCDRAPERFQATVLAFLARHVHATGDR